MIYTVTMETTVIDMVAVSDWAEFRIRSWILIRHVVNSKCVKICWLLVVFTRVGSIKGSPAIRGDTGYLEVGTVSSDVKLYWPGIAGRVMWQLTEACVSSSHMNNEHLLKTSLVVWFWAMWSHLNAFDDKLFEAWVGFHHCLVNPRTVNTAWSELTVDEDSSKFQLRV